MLGNFSGGFGGPYRPIYVFSPSSTNPKYRIIKMDKGGHVYCAIFVSFCSNYRPYPIFQNLVHDFCRFSMSCSGFFSGGGGQNRVYAYNFLCKIHLFGRT